MNHPIRRVVLGNAFMLFLVVYNIAVSLGLSFVYLWAQGTPYQAFFVTPWFAMLSQFVSFIVPLIFVFSVTGQSPARLIPRRPLGQINIILIFAISICVQPAMMFLSAVSSLFFPNPVNELMSGMKEYPFIVSFLAVAVIPAFCEESVFRGYILSQHANVDIKKAAFINGLFFGMIHFSAQQFLYAFIMGMLFAFFVYYTRSLWSSVLAHFIVNAVQLLLNQWLSSGGEPAPATDQQVLWQAAVYLLVIAIIFLPAVLILFRSLVTHNRQINMKQDLLDALGEPETITPQNRHEKPFGLFFWGVVLVYIGFMVLIVGG